MGIRYKYDKQLNKMIVLGFDKDVFMKDLKIAGIVQGVPVKEITDNAFKLSKITSIYLPATIEIIGRHAFAHCKHLTSVSVGDIEQEVADVLTIRPFAFEGCENLLSVNAWSDVVSIDDYAFANCKSLNSVIMGVYRIGEYAFCNCSKLSSLDFEEHAILCKNCFAGCNLDKIRIIGDATIHPNTLEHLKNEKTRICCTKNSSLLDLVYDGYRIETNPEDIYGLLNN